VPLRTLSSDGNGYQNSTVNVTSTVYLYQPDTGSCSGVSSRYDMLISLNIGTFFGEG